MKGVVMEGSVLPVKMITRKSEELLVVAFNMTNKEALAGIRGFWSKEGETEYKSCLGRNEEDTRLITSDQLGGEIALYNPQNISVPLAQVAVRTPMGLYYDKTRKLLFAGTDHWVTAVSMGSIHSVLNNRFFNCIHWLSRTHDGNLLVTATGIDAILKVSMDMPERLLSSWFATERGYGRTPSGERRFIDREIFHQGIEYCTPQHTTHINSAVEHDKDRILATLFHQGDLVEIDLCGGGCSVILSGLKNPHAIRKASFGYILSDTNNGRIIKLDKNLKFIGELKGKFDWLQDAIELESGNFVVADVNNGRLIVMSNKGSSIDQCVYGYDNKKVGSMLTVSREEAREIFGFF